MSQPGASPSIYFCLLVDGCAGSMLAWRDPGKRDKRFLAFEGIDAPCLAFNDSGDFQPPGSSAEGQGVSQTTNRRLLELAFQSPAPHLL